MTPSPEETRWILLACSLMLFVGIVIIRGLCDRVIELEKERDFYRRRFENALSETHPN